MNWHVFYGVLSVLVFFGFVGSFALMMASFEYDSLRRGGELAVLVVAVGVLFAFLLSKAVGA